MTAPEREEVLVLFKGTLKGKDFQRHVVCTHAKIDEIAMHGADGDPTVKAKKDEERQKKLERDAEKQQAREEGEAVAEALQQQLAAAAEVAAAREAEAKDRIEATELFIELQLDVFFNQHQYFGAAQGARAADLFTAVESRMVQLDAVISVNPDTVLNLLKRLQKYASDLATQASQFIIVPAWALKWQQEHGRNEASKGPERTPMTSSLAGPIDAQGQQGGVDATVQHRLQKKRNTGVSGRSHLIHRYERSASWEP